MARDNQLDVNHDDDTYFCHSCDRHFNTYQGALNHCRNAQTHRGEWCERCEWLFVSSEARQSHIDNSSHHNLCDPCDLDFSTFQGLEDHNVDVHNMCTDCGKYFENYNNLEQHRRTHLPADIECLGCHREFSEFAAMIIHLESGNCASGIDRDDINNWVFDDGYRCAEYTNDWTDYYKYQCPNCDTNFRFLSGLCQHVASNACDQDPDSTFLDIKACIQSRI